MIRFQQNIDQTAQREKNTVYVDCSENQEERSQLEGLLDQTKTICSIVGDTGETGLRIVAQFDIREHLVGIFSLTKKIVLSREEIEKIRQEAIRRLN